MSCSNAERKLKGNILKEANAYCSNAVDIVRKGNKINNGKIKLQETFLPFQKLWELTTVLPEHKCV